MSMLKQPECMSEGSNDPEPMDTSTSNVCNPEPTNASSNTPSDPVSHYANVLESFTRDHGLRVHNVPRDGNCLFTSVACQLPSVGNDVNESSLRQMVIDCHSYNCAWLYLATTIQMLFFVLSSTN